MRSGAKVTPEIRVLDLAWALESSSRMSESALSQALQATPLATLLGRSDAPPELSACRGTFTPREFDAPERETAALLNGAAVHDLGWLRRIAVRGEDRFRWLSGMVTNMVTELAVSAGAWNLVLNAQGRIQGDLYVWRDGDSLELEIAADQYDKLLAHFDRFIIMDDVELVPLSLDPDSAHTGQVALGLTGPRSVEILTALHLPVPPEPLTSLRAVWGEIDLRIVRGYGLLVPHYELWAPAAASPALWQALTAAGATPVGAVSLEALRVAEAIPVYGTDMVERDLPQETAQMRALHFSKGCYLGQEIVERIRSRGAVHRHLRPLELTGPLPALGAPLTFDSPTAGPAAAAGHITSAAHLPLPSGPRFFALGLIRAEAELRNQPLTYTAGTATGTARILAAAPELELNPIGNQEP